MPTTPAALLEHALAADPSRPLLTAYDDATGERTELSVVTFATWVAKTANLLRDELGLAPGATVAVRLPLHWQALVWLQACWSLGLVVDLDGTERVDVVVLTHDTASGVPPADEAVSLGLGPMGLPRPGVLPAHPGALDYDRSVPGHGDRFVPGASVDPASPALHAGTTVVTGAALAAAATGSPRLPSGGRLLVTEPLTGVRDVLAALLVPLATGATAVLCPRLDLLAAPALAARIEQEGLVAALASGDADPPGGLTGYHPASPG